MALLKFDNRSGGVHHFVIGIIIGLLALVANLLTVKLRSEISISIGDLILLIGACLVGIPTTLISLFTAVIPPALLYPEETFHGTRIALLCVIIAWNSTKYPKLPRFVAAFIVWILILGPIIYFSNLQKEISFAVFVMTASTDVLLVMLAAIISRFTALRTWLSPKENSQSGVGLFVELIPALGVLTISVTTLVLTYHQWTSGIPTLSNYQALLYFALFTVTIIVASLLGILIERLSEGTVDSPIATLRQYQEAFSGLASAYWRRKEQEGDLTVSISNIRDRSNLTTQLASDSEQSTRSISSDKGICALNRNGTITFLNRKFREFAGVVVNDAVGKNIDAVGLEPNVCKHILDLVEATFTKGPRVIELKINQLPDKLRFFEVASLRSDSFQDSSLNDGPDSIIITLKEITERRTIEERLLKAQKLESLGGLVSGIAHAFNNALTTIAGHASFAKFKQDSTTTREALDHVLETAQDAGRTVQRLLEFSNDRANLVRVHSLESMITEQVDFIKKSIGDEFEITLNKPAEQCFIKCDSNLLMLALTNLLFNAKESYSTSEGKIEVSLGRETFDDQISYIHIGAKAGTYARVIVKDFGVGMPSEILARAFDPLFTTKSSSGHTGLGLSTVFAIVRAHDGFLFAESHPGKGTTVSVYLPLVDPPVDTSHELVNGSQNGSPSVNKNASILVVEDDKTVRDLIVTMLSSLSYSVKSCGTVEEAQVSMADRKYDLVLVDVVLPRISGEEFVSSLRASMSDIRIILMTGGISTTLDPSLVDGFLKKPFDMETLTKEVQNVLGKKTAINRQISG